MEKQIVSSGKYSSRKKSWTIKVSRGGRKATATGPDFTKTYRAALASLKMMEEMSSKSASKEAEL